MVFDTLKPRLLSIIEGLYVEQDVKDTLREAVEREGVTVALVEEVRGIIEQSIVEYEREASEKIKELEDRLDAALREYDDEMSALDREALDIYQKVQTQEKEEGLGKIRGQLGSL